MTYNDQDVWNQINTPGNTIRFRYEHLDNEDDTKGWITELVTGCTITHDYTAQIKRTAKISMLDLDSGIDFLNDRIRPWIGIQMPDGGWADYPQGVFLLSTPTRHYEDGLITRDIDGFDKTKTLWDASFGDGDTTLGNLVIPAGVPFTDQIVHYLNQGRILDRQIKILDHDQATIVTRLHTLRKHKQWKAGTLNTSNLHRQELIYKKNRVHLHQVIAKLIKAINYEALWFDGMGSAIVQPYQEPDSAPIDHLYETDNPNILLPVVDDTLDLFNVPNIVVLVVSQSDRPMMQSKFVNRDPSSPVSTIRRGRNIVHFDDSLDVATQAHLDALCKQTAIGFANVYETVNFSTMINPTHTNRDIIQLNHTPLGLSDKFMEIGWSVECKAGGTMTHVARRVVNLDAALIGDPVDV